MQRCSDPPHGPLQLPQLL
uniref:Uncharacterized protein n=1 Tax=Arundo donax TaxID=35708 RepID=A0A0A8ZC93_ARUDO